MKIVSALQNAFGEAPKVSFVLGSGLGPLVDQIEVEGRCAYPELGLPSSGVVGHAGEAVVGTLNGVRVIAMSGRAHLYEGWKPAEVVRGIRALAEWGVESVLLTNAAGGCYKELPPGTLVLLNDHINYQGCSPLVGPAWGTRFPDMSNAYDREVRQMLRDTAKEEGVELKEGVYIAMLGPAYETAAEIQMGVRMGANVVGMSTVPEVLAAAEVGLRVGVVSVVTNYATGVSDAPVDHSAVTAVAGKASLELVRVFRGVLPRLVS